MKNDRYHYNHYFYDENHDYSTSGCWKTTVSDIILILVHCTVDKTWQSGAPGHQNQWRSHFLRGQGACLERYSVEGTRRAATTANSLKTQLSEGTEAPWGALGLQNWRQSVYLVCVFFAKALGGCAHVGVKKGGRRVKFLEQNHRSSVRPVMPGHARWRT